MKKYINTRQLAFLIFILLAIFLIRFFRGDSDQVNQQGSKVESSLDKEFRQKQLRLNELAACQATCMEIADSSLQIVLRYGMINGNGDTQSAEGRNMNGEMINFQFVSRQDYNLVIRFPNAPNGCDCSK